VESNWKQGVVAGGRDSQWTNVGSGQLVKAFIRAARLITPFPIIGFTMRSLWQANVGTSYRLVFSASDLTIGTPFFPIFDAAPAGTPFPGGFAVEPDFPVTVL